MQTRDGYLWLGTYGGLVRFDGLTFTQIKNPKNGFTHYRILSLYESYDGGIWIGTEGEGVSKYFKGNCTSFTKDNGLVDDVVFSIIEDRDSVLWMGTQSGIQCLVKGKIQLPVFSETFAHVPVRSLHYSKDGILWINSDRGVYRLVNGKLDHVLAGDKNNQTPMAFLYEDRDGSLWFSGHHSLLRYRDGSYMPTMIGQGLKDAYVTSMVQDSSGEYWIGTIADGLYHSSFHPERMKIKAIPLPDGNQKIKIQTCFIDREGNRWIGTDGYGLLRIKDRLIDVVGAKNGLTDEIVEAVFEDSKNSIWIGTNGGGVYCKKGNAIRHFTANNTLGPVWSIAEDNTGALWIGSYGEGVFRFKDNKFKKFTTEQGLSDNAVLALYRDRSGAIWMGTDRGGVTILKGGKFSTLQEKEGLTSTSVRTFLEDHSGTLWIGTLGGLNKYSKGTVTSYTTRNGLSNNYVRSIYEDREGVLWIGTYGGGLNRMKDGVFIHYTMREGLFDDVVSAILEDDRGNLWMSCNRGIFTASLSQLNDFAEGKISFITCVNYDMEDGLLNNEINGGFQPSAWKTRDGRLLFPTVKGLAIIPLSKIKTGAVIPSVFIEKIFVNQVEYEPENHIEIPYGKNQIEIHYSAISYTDPEHINFKYHLEGAPGEWLDVKDRRIAYFQNLLPGDYTFQVIAANSKGIWNNEGASVSLIVRSPFWERWYFRISIICVLAFMGYVFSIVRQRRLRYAAQQQKLSESRLLDSMEAERKRIAYELHDSIGQELLVIKNRAVLALGDMKRKKYIKEQLVEISETASQAIQETREISYNLRPYQIDRLGLKKALESILSRATQTSKITFHSDIDPIDNVIPKEKEIQLYRIIQESINNILKHSNASTCMVVIKLWNDRLNIKVNDNGIGFDMTNKNFQETRGFGLHGIIERTRLLGGTVKIESVTAKGTSILITMKTYERKTDSK